MRGLGAALLRRRLASGLGVAGILMGLDQLLKTWILDVVMNPPRVLEITPFFNLVLVWNRG
ncbi:signal peptidase II, partial [Pararhodospirillum photometricum]|uniref:Lipoprotein signal peptidase n=1 Tax=Pararhodospirillum photometricum DSM 122 TaxID=1150469 RepID=H6SPJ7_PARPM|nr:Lipoprotein signal peptidase [Pararhodospirillum photometricum DSM 122]